MSNALAVAAVTDTLVNLLDNGINAVIPGTSVTARPPERARTGLTGNQLNIFLYQADLNPAWRNMDLPRQVRPGETGIPPLALDLYYLLCAYGQNDEDSQGHRVLGTAMSLIHDHPVFSPAELEAALSASELHLQVERVRITPVDLSLEEISKLWTAFQSGYRISVAYRVSVVLIESTLPGRAPLPVLRRGPQDAGAHVLAEAGPVLSEARPASPFQAVRLGEDILLFGQRLDGENISLRLTHLRLPAPLELALQPGASAARAQVHLPSTGEDPDAMGDYAAGFYTLAAVVSRPGLPAWASNEVALALAPLITVSPLTAAPGTVNLTLTCTPRVREGQRVSLVFGNRQLAPDSLVQPADPAQPTQLAFTVSGVAAGSYVVRLRVDGADSLPFVLSGTPPQLTFDPAQRVVIA